MSGFEYVGDELQLFANARRWKGYLRRQMEPFITGDVLEVGAGLGGTTAFLCGGTESSWVCLEPDGELLDQLKASLGKDPSSGGLPDNCVPMLGTTMDLPAEPTYDTILYIDVLEHIEDDRGEVARAASLLKPGGRVVALSPAHQSLFTPFDESIGHYRRYSKAGFGSLGKGLLETERLVYLDSVGLFASLANKLLLRQSMPTTKQIALWDGAMVPVSRVLDPLLLRSIGKSVLAVWRRGG